jgi:hypothetical protein
MGHEIAVQENWCGLFGKFFPFHLYFPFLLCIDNKNGNLFFLTQEFILHLYVEFLNRESSVLILEQFAMFMILFELN